MTKEILIIDIESGTETQRPMTPEELAEYEYRWQDPEEVKQAAEKQVIRNAILDKLGLTEEEVKVLLG